jgi:Uma2 family endonuclease
MFLQAGTRHSWFIDPEAKTVMIFDADVAPSLLTEGDVLMGGDVLPDFNMPVAEIFSQEEM